MSDFFSGDSGWSSPSDSSWSSPSDSNSYHHTDYSSHSHDAHSNHHDVPVNSNDSGDFGFLNSQMMQVNDLQANSSAAEPSNSTAGYRGSGSYAPRSSRLAAAHVPRSSRLAAAHVPPQRIGWKSSICSFLNKIKDFFLLK